MTPKQKAKELVGKYKEYVHGYIGSSMLSNHEYPEQILLQAKKASLITANEVTDSLGLLNQSDMKVKYEILHWKWVKDEINNIIE